MVGILTFYDYVLRLLLAAVMWIIIILNPLLQFYLLKLLCENSSKREGNDPSKINRLNSSEGHLKYLGKIC